MNENRTSAGSSLPISRISIPWYRREDFATIKTLMVDADKLHSTWDEWQVAAKQTVKSFQAKGYVVECVVLIPDEFTVWCKARGKKFDADGRGSYADYVSYQKNKQAS